MAHSNDPTRQRPAVERSRERVAANREKGDAVRKAVKAPANASDADVIAKVRGTNATPESADMARLKARQPAIVSPLTAPGAPMGKVLTEAQGNAILGDPVAQAAGTGQQVQTPYGTVGSRTASPYEISLEQQRAIVAAHPEIGIAGSPANLAFLAAHRTSMGTAGPTPGGAPLMPPDPMTLANQAMEGLKPKPTFTPTIARPSPPAQPTAAASAGAAVRKPVESAVFTLGRQWNDSVNNVRRQVGHAKEFIDGVMGRPQLDDIATGTGVERSAPGVLAKNGPQAQDPTSVPRPMSNPTDIPTEIGAARSAPGVLAKPAAPEPIETPEQKKRRTAGGQLPAFAM